MRVRTHRSAGRPPSAMRCCESPCASAARSPSVARMRGCPVSARRRGGTALRARLLINVGDDVELGALLALHRLHIVRLHNQRPHIEARLLIHLRRAGVNAPRSATAAATSHAPRAQRTARRLPPCSPTPPHTASAPARALQPRATRWGRGACLALREPPARARLPPLDHQALVQGRVQQDGAVHRHVVLRGGGASRRATRVPGAGTQPHLVRRELLVDAVQAALRGALARQRDAQRARRAGSRALWRSSDGCCSNISSANSRRLNDRSAGPPPEMRQKSS